MSTDLEKPPEPEIDTTFPVQETDAGGTEILYKGKSVARSSFADALDKKPSKSAPAREEAPDASAETSATHDEGDKKDIIAQKIAEKNESAEQPPEKSKSLLDDALNKVQTDKAKKAEKADKAPEKDAKEDKQEDVAAVTDKDIEEELKNPHISDKRAARIKALHKQWKEADAKAATTAKQLAEKDAKLAEIEKKLSEAGKAGGVAPEVQAQLDELQQYRRQYEVEKSPEYKKFDDAHVQAEQEILSTLKNSWVKLKGHTWEQTEAYIKEVGGYASFQKKHPDIARQIREDFLEVADSDEVQSAIGRQRLLKKAQSAFIDGEKAAAKEFFSKQEAERKAAMENTPKPEVEKQARKAKLEQWRDQTIAEVELFKDSAAPEDASEETKSNIKQQNELKAFLRSNLASNINLDKEEDVARVALDATLAHFFKKQNDGLYAENEQLRAEIKKIKSASKTITKGTQVSAPISEKPAKTFEEQLSRLERNR